MTDFEKDILMREVDDEVRRERLQQFWKTFGSYVVGASILIVVATIGIVAWQSYEKAQEAKLTSQLLAAQQAEFQKNPDEAETLLKEVSAARDASLSALAEIRLRELYLRQGKTREAAALKLEPEAAGTPDVFSWFAGMLGANPEKLQALDTEGNPFRATARELLAIRYLKEKKYSEASALLSAIRDDAETPPTMQERAELLLSTIPDSETSRSSAP